MRKLFIICSVILQILLLAFMAGQREYVLHTGRTIYLRTVPFDPRDYFRGDYVTLNYEISTIDEKYFRDGLVAQSETFDYYRKDRGKVVYTVLKLDDGQLASVDYVTDKKPSSDKLFIRGRIQYKDSSEIRVAYSIEAFYVEQGKGGALENRLSGTSLEMEIALGSDGIAVLKGYRTSPLSITAKNFVKKDDVVQSCEIVLTNISSKPTAVVDLPGYGSLKFQTSRSFARVPKEAPWQDHNQPIQVQDKDVHVLQPQQTYTFKIDFNDPYWNLGIPKIGSPSQKDPNQPFEVKDINKFAMMYMSIVYDPPSIVQCKGVENENLIWHGKLSTNMLSSYYPHDNAFPPFMRR
jgi:uncharacterized membrane-anchored protein